MSNFRSLSKTNGSTPSLLGRIWRTPVLRTAAALAVALLSGLITALTLPRGPVTSAQALLLMAAGLLIGLIAGLTLRSRWAMLLAPVAHMAAFELGRAAFNPVAGPTVAPVRLDNVYGILSLLLGRGFHGLVGLLPMLLGVSLGLALAGRLSGAPKAMRRGGAAGRVFNGTLAVLLLALAVFIALPARTPPITNALGDPVPGSIAELTRVRLGGQDQTIMVRGANADRPVLLYLSGGPGQSDLPYSRVLFQNLADDFIVVSWDQRGTGKSYAAFGPTATLTLDQAVADTIALTHYLCERFDEEKIYLLGESWGSILGTLAVQRQPELYYALIGSGQMVSPRETTRRLHQDVLALAERTGNAELAAQMQAFGEPPYADVFAGAFVMGYYEQLYRPYTPPQAYIALGTAAGLGPWGVLGSEYSLVDKVNVLRGLIDLYAVMWPQLQELDFRRDAPRLEVPVYILDGEAELNARRELMLEWYAMLQAPSKQMFSFENAGHSVAFEQFEAFENILTGTILPATYTP